MGAIIVIEIHHDDKSSIELGEVLLALEKKLGADFTYTEEIED